MNKEYTHRTTDGMPARIVVTDRDHPTHPIIALVKDSTGYENSVYLTKGLCRTMSDDGHWHHPFLTETSLWDDVAIDTPVWVKKRESYLPRHFASYTAGKVRLWNSGLTSHTAPGEDGWTSTYLPSNVCLEKPTDA